LTSFPQRTQLCGVLVWLGCTQGGTQFQSFVVTSLGLRSHKDIVVHISKDHLLKEDPTPKSITDIVSVPLYTYGLHTISAPNIFVLCHFAYHIVLEVLSTALVFLQIQSHCHKANNTTDTTLRKYSQEIFFALH
jgi:hypothetical protein